MSSCQCCCVLAQAAPISLSKSSPSSYGRPVISGFLLGGGSGPRRLDASRGLEAVDDGQQVVLGPRQVHVEQVPEPARRAQERAGPVLDLLLPAADGLEPLFSLLHRGCLGVAVRAATGLAVGDRRALTGCEIGLPLGQQGPPLARLFLERSA